MFTALGNDCPEILVQLEDEVLKAIMGIAEGKPRDQVMSDLYSRIQFLEKLLADDDAALNWFKYGATATSKTATPAIPSTPFGLMAHHLKNRFEGQNIILELCE